jgi:hypothetical protein
MRNIKYLRRQSVATRMGDALAAEPDPARSRSGSGQAGARLSRRAAFLAASLIITAGSLAAGLAGAGPAAASVGAASAPDAPPDPCQLPTWGPPTIQATWQYDGDYLGTVKVVGCGFTADALLDINLAMPDWTYTQQVTASHKFLISIGDGVLVTMPGGSFTVTQSGVACGVNEDSAEGESTIDVYEPASGADRSVNISTPCTLLRMPRVRTGASGAV